MGRILTSHPQNSPTPELYPVTQVNAPAKVHFSLSKVTVPPGKSATVVINIAAPSNVDKKRLPVVSGWVTFAGSLGDFVRVSYVGIAGNLQAAQTISTGNQVLVSGGLPAVIPLVNGILEPQRGPRFVQTISSDTASTQMQLQELHTRRPNLPSLRLYVRHIVHAPNSYSLLIRLSLPSRRVVIDLVLADTAIKSTVPDPLDSAPLVDNQQEGLTRRGWSWWWPGLSKPKPSDTFSKVPTVGRIAEWEYLPRGPVAGGVSFCCDGGVACR